LDNATDEKLKRHRGRDLPFAGRTEAAQEPSASRNVASTASITARKEAFMNRDHDKMSQGDQNKPGQQQQGNQLQRPGQDQQQGGGKNPGQQQQDPGRKSPGQDDDMSKE